LTPIGNVYTIGAGAVYTNLQTKKGWNMAKTLVSFRLDDDTRDGLQELVDLLRERDRLERMTHITRDRTNALVLAVNNFVERLRQEKLFWEKKRKEETAEKDSRGKVTKGRNVPTSKKGKS
jgi:hypothetical protein